MKLFGSVLLALSVSILILSDAVFAALRGSEKEQRGEGGSLLLRNHLTARVIRRLKKSGMKSSMKSKSSMDTQTVSPTGSPTSAPTGSPTQAPTESPVALPTSSPTDSPTSRPTVIPTALPTSSPTELPTFSPTSPPTVSPTHAPTDSPIALPTSSPTDSPTASPNESPTGSPTASPTSSPTDSPTSSPTSTPTGLPTQAPVDSVTALPTSTPTVSPTANPTNSPTANPTASPTSSPTALPTTNPTNSPTVSPTQTPSSSPTALPTSAPTDSPMANPTFLPTGTHSTASPMGPVVIICSVCGDGFQVGSPNAVLVLPDQTMPSCLELEQRGKNSEFSPTECNFFQSFLDSPSNPCQCKAAPCSVCGDGLQVGDDSIPVELPDGTVASCGDLEQMGKDGSFSPNECTSIQSFLATDDNICECAPPPTCEIPTPPVPDVYVQFVNITECGTGREPIKVNDTYITLENDIFCGSGDVDTIFLNIIGDRNTIDCGGNIVENIGTFQGAFKFNGKDNVLQNCPFVMGFRTGNAVEAKQGSRLFIFNVTTAENFRGLFLDGAEGYVSDSVFRDNTNDGIQAEGRNPASSTLSYRLVLKGSSVTSNGQDGLDLNLFGDACLEETNVFKNGDKNIEISEDIDDDPPTVTMSKINACGGGDMDIFDATNKGITMVLDNVLCDTVAGSTTNAMEYGCSPCPPTCSVPIGPLDMIFSSEVNFLPPDDLLFEFTDLPDAFGPVTITVAFRGDFGRPDVEFITIKDEEGVEIGVASSMDGTIGDCNTDPHEVDLVDAIALDRFNEQKNQGASFVVTVEFSDVVTSICDGTNGEDGTFEDVTVTLSYPTFGDCPVSECSVTIGPLDMVFLNDAGSAESEVDDLVFKFVGLPDAVGPVTVGVAFRGDFGNNLSEFIFIKDEEDVEIGVARRATMNDDPFDCDTTAIEATLGKAITQSGFNTQKNDGSFDITAVFSDGVNTQCDGSAGAGSTFNDVAITLSYDTFGECRIALDCSVTIGPLNMTFSNGNEGAADNLVFNFIGLPESVGPVTAGVAFRGDFNFPDNEFITLKDEEDVEIGIARAPGPFENGVAGPDCSLDPYQVELIDAIAPNRFNNQTVDDGMFSITAVFQDDTASVCNGTNGNNGTYEDVAIMLRYKTYGECPP